MRLRGSFLTIAGITLATLTILYLIWRLDWRETYILLANAKVDWILLAFVFFIFNYIFRTLRFKALYNRKDMKIRGLFGVTFLYGMFNYVMPAKTGELFYVFIARSQLDVNILQSTSVILAARLFDILAIGLFIPIVLIYGEAGLPAWMYKILILFEVIVVLLLAAVLVGARVYSAMPNSSVNTKWSHIRKELMAAFNVLKGWPGTIYTLMLAMAIWFCIYANFYCIIRGLGYEADLYQLIMISIVLIPLTLLPQGVANLGTHEVAWVGVFQMFGYSHQDALQIAFGSHVILTLCVLLLGAMGLGIVNKRKH